VVKKHDIVFVSIIVLLAAFIVVAGYLILSDRGDILRQLGQAQSDNRDNLKLITDAKRIIGERDVLVGQLDKEIAGLTDRITEYQKLVDQGKTIFAGLIKQNRQLVDQLYELRKIIATGTIVSH
jgi:type II secretory pathway component HofQ